MNIADLIAANTARWKNAGYHTNALAQAVNVATRLTAPAAKAVYEELAQVGVPWYVIAVIHEREASQDWADSLAQGDPWNRVSVNEPKGRGPFASFVAAGHDALVNCPPYAARWKDWSVGGALSLLELYNGEGYENYHHIASPYLWAGTDQYVSGKYVADGKYDPLKVDTQLGCAVLLTGMRTLDPSIKFEGE